MNSGLLAKRWSASFQTPFFRKSKRDSSHRMIGLRGIKCGPPLAVTAHRAKGYDLALVAEVDSLEDIKAAAHHPAHLKYSSMFPCLISLSLC